MNSKNQHWLAVSFLGLSVLLATAAASAVHADDPDSTELRPSLQNVSPHALKSLGKVIRTDERYGHDGIFQGPRGYYTTTAEFESEGARWP